jgi:DNA-binding response OmpR family regulator
MLEVFLGFCGWDVSCASTPAEALTRIHHEDVDLVILDRWFADEDGLELFGTLRSHLPDLPIIFLSGAVHPEDVRKATEAGCSGYLAKPCDLEELARVVIHLTGKRRTEAPPKND